MWLRTECNLTFDITIPTPFILMLRPRNDLSQWVAKQAYTITPNVPVTEYTDSFGNACQRLVAPVGTFSVSTSATVLTSPAPIGDRWAGFNDVETLPNEVLGYLLPSRYCESDRFVEMAHSIVTGCVPGYEQVAAIENWIRTHVRFNPDSMYFQLSATEVNQSREGVCRELAHLGIAMCRSLCIPARMVVGYLHGLTPMDMHAWFEAYVGGRWYTFDATQPDSSGARVAIAFGHDASDVATFTQFGPAVPPKSMTVDVREIAPPEDVTP
ncbi:transglutaminase family protein [Alteromonas gilva]|uniref:Transglutaminase family protein n=1 Tax=Alteromonas gilva TaxID=2987522 RepID=A0ABT5KZN9_9ALTE|nr:transglutaminase family protein [Alteromonas gilva]MDC8830235.1 transglutaminase family protein [Alteromonas gilva]